MMLTLKARRNSDEEGESGGGHGGGGVPGASNHQQNKVYRNTQPIASTNYEAGTDDTGITPGNMRRGRGPGIRVKREWLEGLHASAVASGMTQDELAARADQDDSQVSRLWKKLERPDLILSVSRDLVVALAEALKYPMPFEQIGAVPAPKEVPTEDKLERYAYVRKILANRAGLAPGQIDSIADFLAEVGFGMTLGELREVVRKLSTEED